MLDIAFPVIKSGRKFFACLSKSSVPTAAAMTVLQTQQPQIVIEIRAEPGQNCSTSINRNYKLGRSGSRIGDRVDESVYRRLFKHLKIVLDGKDPDTYSTP